MFTKNTISDILSGLTTAFAAIALGAAFGSESGRGAFAGMIAAAVIPIITSTFGGTRLQASGPTAPMTTVAKVVIMAFAYHQFKQGGMEAEKLITLTFLLSGIFMIIAGLFRLGKLINLVPQVVLLGFMNGIGFIILLDQLKKLFGFGGFNLQIGSFSLINMKSVSAIGGDTLLNLTFALVTLFLLFTLPYFFKQISFLKKIASFIPTTLIVITVMTIIYSITNLKLETVSLGKTIDSPLGLFKIAADFFPNLAFIQSLSTEIWLKVIQFALQLALLGYLDSLLTSLVIDNITKEKTKKNQELMAQGLGNMVASIFGGIPGAQATIRSVLLLKEGAKTRLAGVFVGIFTFIGIFIFKDLITLVAYSIFIGILIKAGWDVFERDFILDFLKDKKKYLPQMLLVLYTTILTVFFDLNIAVISATILFYILQKYTNFKDYLPEHQGLSTED